ncbi:DMT family transporter [Wenzhouxiangella sp. AB-CW3]|uniref:DMT family transporter n=1 Tax=Wenzhouxiangella sp. AB-CW3 TaxID=2771012 RepID=UPI00168BAF3B|nr:DMT family transporter [Wenzhouxiangella sp. AB-CW3]QOC21404.1 DMT family transporter [Wenzhouxiangella sp. AB-CW3]
MTSLNSTKSTSELRVMAELTLLGAIWGGSFLLMRVAAPEFGPLALVELRLAFGALVLLPFVYRARRQLEGRWVTLFLIGIINSAVPFLLFAWATAVAPAAIAAIANSMTALFAALIAGWMFGERLGPRRCIGLLAGMAGVIVMAGIPMAGVPVGWAALAATAAALCYGFSGNLVRRYLGGLPPVALGGATLACSALLVLPLALLYWPEHDISPAAWGSAIMLGVLCTGIAYAFLFRLLDRIGAARTATVTYLVPLFGVAWAWIILGEPLTTGTLIAGILILGGVALGQSRQPAPAALKQPRA